MAPGIGDIVKYVLRQGRMIRRLWVPFAAAVLVVGCLIWLAMEWRYRGIIENRDSQISNLTFERARLRVALGIDPATKSALLSLSNTELKARAATLVSGMRGYYKQYQDGTDRIEHDPKLTELQKFQQEQTLAKDIDQEYASDIRSDTLNVNFELMRRLGRDGAKGIIGLPPIFEGRDGSRVSMSQIIAATNDAAVEMGFLGTLMLSIDQMSKRLPDKG